MQTLHDAPVKTVESYSPYATTLVDYVKRAMLFNTLDSLTSDQVYTVVAYILNQANIVGPDAVMDAESLPAVQMPNRDASVPDRHPEVELHRRVGRQDRLGCGTNAAASGATSPSRRAHDKAWFDMPPIHAIRRWRCAQGRTADSRRGTAHVERSPIVDCARPCRPATPPRM